MKNCPECATKLVSVAVASPQTVSEHFGCPKCKGLFYIPDDDGKLWPCRWPKIDCPTWAAPDDWPPKKETSHKEHISIEPFKFPPGTHETCTPDPIGNGVTCDCGLHFENVTGWKVHRFQLVGIPFNDQPQSRGITLGPGSPKLLEKALASRNLDDMVKYLNSPEDPPWRMTQEEWEVFKHKGEQKHE